MGQQKERAGFLVSKSLTLPSAPPRAEAVFDDIARAPQKEQKKMKGATQSVRNNDRLIQDKLPTCLLKRTDIKSRDGLTNEVFD